MPDSVLVGAAEVFVVEVRVLVLDHRDLHRDRILGQHRALGTVEAGRHLVALSWFASYHPRRESRLSRSRLRRFFTNNNVGFSFARLFIIPQDVDVASLILCWWATFIIDLFVMTDDTTDPRLQRFVLVTSGDVPHIPPIIGSHKFASFTFLQT